MLFRSGTALTIKTRANEKPAIGAIQNGDLLAGFVANSGTEFRLITDPNSLLHMHGAKAWAENAEDDPVDVEYGGDGSTTFSAKHWAAKSEEHADRSEAAKVAAEAARDIAAGYASDAALSEAGALFYKNAAEDAASVSGDVKFFDTYADASAALSGLTEGQIVEVLADETRSDIRDRYRVEGGALVYKVALTGLRPYIDALLFGVIPAPLSTPNSSVPDRGTELQSALDFAGNLGGGVVMLPAGKIKGPAFTLKIPDNVWLVGPSRDSCIFVENGDLAATASAIENKNYSDTDGSLGAPGIRIRGITIDGSLREYPAWLSKADGTPVTDPEADYRPGGCLAPTSVATVSLTVTDGEVSDVTITNGGSGYVYPPTLWITGDGYGAVVNLTIADGAVTAATIISGGRGYTAATGEVAGGGADPATALYAADRRNPNYALMGAAVSFIKAKSPIFEDSAVINHGGTAIIDAGSDKCTVRNNRFENGGQTDYVGNCMWSQSHGSISSPPAYFRQSTNPIFENNEVVNWARSVALINSDGGSFCDNVINGWRESAFFVGGDAKNYTIARNKAKNGRIADITCTFVEGDADANVFDNTIESVDGIVFSVIGDGANIRANQVTAPSQITQKYPFGPFSERVGYNVGAAAIAGTDRGLDVYSIVKVANISASAADAPKAARIVGNTIIDPSGVYDHVVTFSKGAANSIGPVLIEGNDITRAPSVELFDANAADLCLDPDKPFRVVNNPGHVSMGAVSIYETISSGTTGVYRLNVGFRPRLLWLYARTSAGGQLAATWAIFADEEAKNPGSAGPANTTGSQIKASIYTPLTIATASLEYGGLQVSDSSGTTFNAIANGFSSSGWSMNILTCNSDIILAGAAMP